MNKSELIQAISRKSNLKVTHAEKGINSLIETVANELRNKRNVTLVGFGTFKVADRAARTGVNPKTGARITIKAKRVPKLSPGKALKEKVR